MNYIERIQMSIDFMETTLIQEINLQDIPEHAYMSVSTDYRIFYNCVGVTLKKEYIRNRRLDIASKLLADTDMKIMEVAFDTGFESHEVFSRNFKKVTGFSPLEFRKNKKTRLLWEGEPHGQIFRNRRSEKLLKKYPDIRILKELAPIDVAYYVG